MILLFRGCGELQIGSFSCLRLTDFLLLVKRAWLFRFCIRPSPKYERGRVVFLPSQAYNSGGWENSRGDRRAACSAKVLRGDPNFGPILQRGARGRQSRPLLALVRGLRSTVHHGRMRSGQVHRPARHCCFFASDVSAARGDVRDQDLGMFVFV